MSDIIFNPHQKNFPAANTENQFSTMGKLIIKLSNGKIKTQDQINKILVFVTIIFFLLTILTIIFFY